MLYLVKSIGHAVVGQEQQSFLGNIAQLCKNGDPYGFL